MKAPKKFKFFFFIGLLGLGGILFYLRNRWLRSLLLYLSTAVWAQQFVTRNPLAWRVAGRFIAGETIEDAITTSRQVNAAGMSVTVNFLGEHVHSAKEATLAREEILRLLDSIAASGVNASISIKPSQLGLNVAPDHLYENLKILLERARQVNNKIQVDMEESKTVDTTLRIYRHLRDDDGFGDHVGIVVQAYLYRSQDDVNRLAEEGSWLRLCKGAYAEPAEVAFPVKADTDANYLNLAGIALSRRAREQGMYTGFATHDEKMISGIIDFATANDVAAEEFEFQMLYGIRRELQAVTVARGYQLRLYIPYGTAWYPYFVRRLAERPANLWFFLSNVLRQ